MCGRFSLATSIEKLQDQFGVERQDPLESSFNIAPTHPAYVIADEDFYQVQQMSWGLVPYWSNDGKNSGKLINARAEGISSKPSFRIPIRQRRCLVIADSFYEWRREGQEKIPYRIKPKDESLLALAGIWDIWTNGKTSIKSFSIITTTANREVGTLHQRMPVILSTKDQQDTWLTNPSLDRALDLLQTLPDDSLEIYRISSKLNSPANNSIDLHQLVPEPPTLF